MRTSLTLAAFGLLFVLPGAHDAAASTAAASRAAVHEVHLDPGTLSQSCTWLVRVEKGDTLSEIAERHLGTARRAGEIQRLNPRADPRALRVGQSLALPPKRTAAAGPWVDFLVAAEGGPVASVGLGEPAAVPLGTLRVFAVPHEHLVVLRAAARGPDLSEAALRSDPRVAVSDPFEAASSDGRALARAVTRLRVTGLSGRNLRVIVAEQNLYGATGHRVPAAEDGDTGGGLAVPLLLILAGLGVFALVAVAARRMAGGDPEGGSHAA